MKIEQDSFLSCDLPSRGMDSKMVFRNSIYSRCAATRCVSSVQTNVQNSSPFFFTYFSTPVQLNQKKKQIYIPQKYCELHERKYSSNVSYNLKYESQLPSYFLYIHIIDKSSDFKASLIKLKRFLWTYFSYSFVEVKLNFLFVLQCRVYNVKLYPIWLIFNH